MTPLRTPMPPLRAKMLHQLQLHRLASHTPKAYVRAVEDVARFYWRSPDQLTADEIRDYLHHLLVDRQLAWSTCNIVAAGRRFFYLETLGWDALRLNLPPRKGQDLLPRVLSVDELKHLLLKCCLKSLPAAQKPQKNNGFQGVMASETCQERG